MSKSLEFCKRIASNKDRSFFADRDWTNAIEIDSEKIFYKRIERLLELVDSKRT